MPLGSSRQLVPAPHVAQAVGNAPADVHVPDCEAPYCPNSGRYDLVPLHRGRPGMHCVEQAALGAEPPHAPAAQACDAPHCPPALHTWIQVVGSPATEPGGTTHCRAPGAHAMPQIADRDGVVPVLVHVCKPPSADAEQGVCRRAGL